MAYSTILMQIATFIQAHNNIELTTDTAESVKLWMTDKLLVLVDAAGWHHFEDKKLPCDIHKGLFHGQPKSPYRNVLFGLNEIYTRYPDVDWYCYLENDCLVVNDQFQEDLQDSSKWLIGVNHRCSTWDIPLLNEVVGESVLESHYVIGCLMFFNRRFVKKLLSVDLINRMLKRTETLVSGEVPGFRGYAFEEQLFASLANYYKPGSVLSLSHHDLSNSRYPIRFRPDLSPEDIKPGASILHPIKKVDNSIRLHCRKFREKVNARYT